MPCAICNTAKPKRFCQAVRGDICAACCGEGRERTVDCPLECEYLAEAHKHERKVPGDPKGLAGADIELDDSFLRDNEFLIVLLGSAMIDAAAHQANVLDSDANDALDALIAKWKALDAGLYYESRPVNPLAAEMFDAAERRVEEIRERIQEAESAQRLPDSVVLRVLAFLRRVSFSLSNGRPRCKAFLVFLAESRVGMRENGERAAAEEPRVIL